MTKRIWGIVIFMFFTPLCQAQFKVTKPAKSSLPKSIRYAGKFIQALRWIDSTGDNIIVLTKADTVQNRTVPDDGFSDAALYAFHFIVSKDSVRQTWKVYDYLEQCEVDMFLYFIDKTLAVTDLNKDGNGEVWMMYKVSCQGDVSPIPMKIIMYENNKKFAVRGTTKVKVAENEFMGGEFLFDEAFKNGPLEIRQYAEKLWKQHQIETWNH